MATFRLTDAQAAVQSEPVRRHVWRAHQEGPHFLLCLLRRTPHPPGHPSPAVTVPLAQERPSATQAFSDFSAESPFSGTLTNAFALNRGPTVRRRCGAAPQYPDGASCIPTFPGQHHSPGLHGRRPLSICFSSFPLPPMAIRFKPFPYSQSAATNSRSSSTTALTTSKTSASTTISTITTSVLPFAQFQAAGANVPGFRQPRCPSVSSNGISVTPGRISNNTINEFRFNYNREAQRTFQHPQRTRAWCRIPVLRRPPGLPPCSAPCLASPMARRRTILAFIPASGRQHEGLPFIQLSGGFTIGNNAEGELPQVGNSFQWSDSLSKVTGNHSVKFGGDVRRQRFDQTLLFQRQRRILFSAAPPATTLGTMTQFSPTTCWDSPARSGKARRRWRMFAALDSICLPRTAGRSNQTSR